jgi:hypothetical protein
MGELVGQQVLAAPRLGGVLARCEDDVLANRIGSGIEGTGGVGSSRVSVDPHPTEVLTESRLHR